MRANSAHGQPPGSRMMHRPSFIVAILCSIAYSFQPTTNAVTRGAPLKAGFGTTTRKKKVKKGSKSKDAAGLTTDKGWVPLDELTERVELGSAKAVGRSA